MSKSYHPPNFDLKMSIILPFKMEENLKRNNAWIEYIPYHLNFRERSKSYIEKIEAT
jgi:hypothetical protein